MARNTDLIIDAMQLSDNIIDLGGQVAGVDGHRVCQRFKLTKEI